MLLWRFSEPIFFFTSIIVFLVVLELGFRIGHHFHKKGDETAKTHASALQAALLGLLFITVGVQFCDGNLAL